MDKPAAKMRPVHSDTAYELRPYQQHTVQANLAAWAGERRPTGDGQVNRTGNVLATGLGKTVIFCELARLAHARNERTLVLVHRDELAKQAVTKLHSIVPRASVGVVKGSRNEWDADIVVASVPTLARRNRLEQIPSDYFGLGIADEAHHAVADSWRQTLDYFGAFSPAGRAVPWSGFTATMIRGDSRVLGDVWPEVVATYDINYGIQHGYLVKPRGIRLQVKDLMLDRVRRSRGDFTDKDLGDALQDADAGPLLAQAYLEHAAGRRAAMFSPTVDSARAFAEDFEKVGIPTAVITGETTSTERDEIYEAFRMGEVLCLSSVMVLTEGWDAPWAEVVLMARPTSLPGLYTQIVGRVLRPFAAGGKQEALVIDAVGISTRCTLASLVDLVGQEENPYGDEEVESKPVRDELAPPFAVETSPFAVPLDGELVTTEVDLFRESQSAWLCTPSGIWFLATARHYYFVYPRGDGTFTLGKKPVRALRSSKAKKLEANLTLEAGMMWAQWYAAREDDELGRGMISSKQAQWRRRPPSDSLLRFAVKMGVRPIAGENQGQLSDRVTVARAEENLPRPPRKRLLTPVS